MPPARSATARSATARSATARSATARAARSVTARAAAAPRRSPRPGPEATRGVGVRAPKIRVRWERVGRIGLLLVLAVVVGLYVEHALAYVSTRAQANAQQAIVDRLTRQNKALEAYQRSLDDPATIVRDGRALGMIRPDEQSFSVTGLPGH
jgi:cell division protein FtsB